MTARCCPSVPVCCGLILGWLTLSSAAGWPAQEEAGPERFTCETADGVTLVGDFYPPGKAKGERAPCVVLLHAVGPGRATASRGDFGKLPVALQREGFAVVTFDFRGHGESRQIDPVRYYDIYPPTRQLANPAAANKIDSRDFRTPLEVAALANDLIAVKVWLNKQNNLKRCHSHKVGLVGVEQSGLIALLFAINEHRDTNRPLEISAARSGTENRFEGEDLSALVWLSTTDRLGADRLDANLVQAWLQFTQTRSLPLLAVFGEDDQAAKEFWARASSALRPRERDGQVGSSLRRIKGTSLTGLKLLEHEVFGVQKELTTFLIDALRTPNAAWSEHKGNQRPTLINLPLLLRGQ